MPLSSLLFFALENVIILHKNMLCMVIFNEFITVILSALITGFNPDIYICICNLISFVSTILLKILLWDILFFILYGIYYFQERNGHDVLSNKALPFLLIIFIGETIV